MDSTSGVSLESSFRFGYYCGGFSAVPVMTMGAAYDLAQTIGRKQGLSAISEVAKKFYDAIMVLRW